MALESRNPYTGEILENITAHTEKQVDAKLEKAAKLYPDWRTTSFQERAKLMNKAAELLEARTDKYGKLMTMEMGKHIREAKSEIQKCAFCCRYYAEHAEAFLADDSLAVKEGKAFISYHPMGPVLAVMPWNFPFWQVIRFAAPGLMACNLGLLKHASNVPQTAMAIEEIFRDAGFPEAAFQTLLIGSDLVGKVIEHDAVRAVTLTGSEKAGMKVAEQAGRQLKKSVLELGGSDPFIVLADADLKEAVNWAVKSRMVNTGQSCIAAKRFIVEEAIYEDFLSAFKEKIESLRFGDPMDEANDYGPMARADLAEELQEQVQQSLKAGARLVSGSREPKQEGAMFRPVILDQIPKEASAWSEELFGPVASVFKVKDADAAVALANDSSFGLGGSVWTADKERGIALARKVESGAVYVNKMMASDPAVPFGGIKRSGYGRELSHLGIREFVNQKTIWVGE